jgi:hypothetical protein
MTDPSATADYKFRNLPCNVRPDWLLWCVNGGYRGGGGVLEWCYDQEDAERQLAMMQRHNALWGGFEHLSVGPYVPDDKMTPLQNLVRRYGGWGNGKQRYHMLKICGERIGETSFERVVDGVTWIVEPQNPKPDLRYGSRRTRHCSHRVKVKCPECGKVVSAGRIHQHAKKHGVK